MVYVRKGDCNNGVEVACDDSSYPGSDWYSQVEFTAEPNVNYYIFVQADANLLVPEVYVNLREAPCGDYWASTVARTKDEAVAACWEGASELASSYNSFVNQRIANTGTGWINIERITGSGTWEWRYQGSQSVMYFNWAPGEPGPPGEDCVIIDAGGRWHSVSCDERHPYVCDPPSFPR